jgi:flagellar basal-body rod protein FlgF
MSGSIYMATSGAEAQRIRLQILSNNLANINTAGFKEDRAVFRMNDDGLNPDADQGEASEVSATMYSDAIPLTTHTDYSRGPIQRTGNPLDVAIDGDGFFSVQTDQGVRYTRNGAFTINPDGNLSTHDGDSILGEGGEIAIDGADVRFDGSGNVIVDGVVTDKLRIVKITEPTALKKIGKTLFQLDESKGSEESLEYGGVQQGFLEGSNVNAVKVMTELIEVQRGYESYQKMIQTMGEMASRVISGVGTTE